MPTAFISSDSSGNRSTSTAKRDIPLYARLYLEGRFELDALVSKEISLGEVNEGYASLKNPDIARVVITDLS